MKTSFTKIQARLQSEDVNVVEGKMMHHAALKVNDKVFLFEADQGMGFRLGPDFPINNIDEASWEPLSPFKTKPPLKGWYIIHENQSDIWSELASAALSFTKSL